MTLCHFVLSLALHSTSYISSVLHCVAHATSGTLLLPRIDLTRTVNCRRHFLLLHCRQPARCPLLSRYRICCALSLAWNSSRASVCGGFPDGVDWTQLRRIVRGRVAVVEYRIAIFGRGRRDRDDRARLLRVRSQGADLPNLELGLTRRLVAWVATVRWEGVNGHDFTFYGDDNREPGFTQASLPQPPPV